MKGLGCISILAGLSLVSGMAYSQEDGKALLGTLNSKKHYVVTNEVDPVFSKFIGSDSEISIGKDASAKGDGRFDDASISVAIGSPLNAISSWNTNFTKNTEAMYRSVAIGTAAKAKQRVSVAIGNQALIGEVHHNTGETWTYELKTKVVTNTLNSAGKVDNATTNSLSKEIFTVDRGRYERMPVPSSTKWEIVKSSTFEQDGVKYRVEKIRQQTDQIEDISWVDEDEYNMYNRWFDPGQGRMNYRWATYGVAIGSRSFVAGHHSVAVGHYARAVRPHTVALGPGNWVESEGSISLGYDSDISRGSPFSMAIGSRSIVQSGMTNAIVIGVPMVDYQKRESNKDVDMSSPYVWASQPKAIKSNSINIVYNGNGLKDFFVDGVSIPDRMASETRTIGNINQGGSEDGIRKNVRLYGGIDEDDKSMVFCSGDGGIILLTRDYLDSRIDEIDYV